jgi:hypothetical protein
MKQASAGAGATLTLRRVSAFVQVAVLALAALVPFVLAGSASAGQLTTRSATINNSKIHNGTTSINNDAEFVFGYTNIDTAAAKQGITYEFCTNPLGTCTLPTGMSVQSATQDSQSGWPSNGTSFSAHAVTDENDCTMSSNSYMMCFERTSATTGGGAVTHTISGITAPSSIQTVYIRITTYSDNDFQSADELDYGTVAVAFVDQLTINGRVQERLEFCVAGVDDTDTMPADVSTCSALSDSNVDIGIIDESSIAISPVNVTATNGADDDFGILMLNTNSQGGATIGYYADDATSVSGGDTDQLKSFRVVPTNCNATASVTNDQCFVSAVNTGEGSTMTSGSELFGMYIPCVVQNTGGSTTANLTTVNDAYDGSDEAITTVADCENETFTSGSGLVGWNTGSTAETLISSSSVVDDEIVKLRFAATASATTPPGNYTVVTTYIATPTF